MVTASGARIGWADLPSEVKAAVEAVLGGPVVEARSQAGGFSPGTADRVRTADGTRAFVKAVSPEQNERTPHLHRQEVQISAALPSYAPAPALLGSYDDGHWVVLVLSDVEGRAPAIPWQPDEVRLVLAALERLAEVATPAPLDGLAALEEVLVADFTGWERVRADPPDDLNPWAATHLDELCDLSRRALGAVAGETLVHLDIRADNLLLSGDGLGPDTVTIVDWPWACRGAAWFDRVLLLINVRLHGALDTGALLAELAIDTGADRDDLIAVVAGWAGYFTDTARTPPPRGLPTIREFQRAQSVAALSWLAELGLPPSDSRPT